ncbi:MAG: membrane biogenesis protein [Clostridia bacterium]|nr:membrane biogenesis protein [Clostridia bacterium]
MNFQKCFDNKKPVIGMLHLKGDHALSSLERAKKEACIYLEHGVEALLVENYFGSNRDCEAVLAWLQKECPRAKYGVNILGDYEHAFMLAKKYHAAFIQIDSVCGHLPKEQDEMLANHLKALRNTCGAAVLGGVRFKYQAVRSGRSVQEDLLLGMQRCDAIVVTGEGTGMKTPLEKVRQFREVLGDFPLIMGAGMRPEMIDDCFSLCDGAIVGSYFKEGHRDYGDVNPDYVAQFMDEKRKIE